MSNIEHLGSLHAEQGAADAHRYCATRHLIGSVCLCCGRVYRLVPSRGPGGGLSHGWCSQACATVGALRAGVTASESPATVR